MHISSNKLGIEEIKSIAGIAKGIFIGIYLKWLIKRKCKKYKIHKDIANLILDIVGYYGDKDFYKKMSDRLLLFFRDTDDLWDKLKMIDWNGLSKELSGLLKYFTKKTSDNQK